MFAENLWGKANVCLDSHQNSTFSSSQQNIWNEPKFPKRGLQEKNGLGEGTRPSKHPFEIDFDTFYFNGKKVKKCSKQCVSGGPPALIGTEGALPLHKTYDNH